MLHFVDSFFHGSLSLFHILVFDNPGLDLSIGIYLQDSAFKCFGSPPRSGIAGSSIILRLVPWGFARLFSLVVVLFHMRWYFLVALIYISQMIQSLWSTTFRINFRADFWIENNTLQNGVSTRRDLFPSSLLVSRQHWKDWLYWYFLKHS